ncbi:MAG: energy transducer TonB [Paludibacteraceae bacterium]|nr:energy transducer TonB [Paludibacteraceae bacterium]
MYYGKRKCEFLKSIRNLQHYLSKNLFYPAKAREEGMQGVVLVGFVVNKDGSLSNIRVQRSVDESLDQEAIRLVKNMGNWEPALLKNSPVRTMIKFIEK